MTKEEKDKKSIEIKFKKVTLISDSRQFILKYNDEKNPINHYYSNFGSMLVALKHKYLLKSEAKSIKDLENELRYLNDEFTALEPELKKMKNK